MLPFMFIFVQYKGNETGATHLESLPTFCGIFISIKIHLHKIFDYVG